MIEKLREAGLTSDMAYGAAAASIALSIGIWATERDKDQGHAERFGIFVGLWAPTFAILGHVLEDEEREARTMGRLAGSATAGMDL